MADKTPNPKILPKGEPEQKSLQFGQWVIPLKSATVQVIKRVVKYGFVLALLSWAGWSLQNFLQLRGVVNILASRINLAFFWVALFLVGWMLAVGIRQKLLCRIFIAIILVGCVVGLDWWAPRPTVQTEVAPLRIAPSWPFVIGAPLAGCGKTTARPKMLSRFRDCCH